LRAPRLELAAMRAELSQLMCTRLETQRRSLACSPCSSLPPTLCACSTSPAASVCRLCPQVMSPRHPQLRDCVLQGGTATHAHMDAWALAAHSAGAPWALPHFPRLVHRLDKGWPPVHTKPFSSRRMGCSAPPAADTLRLSLRFANSSSLIHFLLHSDTSGVLVMAKGRYVVDVGLCFCVVHVHDVA
jgi:hypothetical protein